MTDPAADTIAGLSLVVAIGSLSWAIVSSRRNTAGLAAERQQRQEEIQVEREQRGRQAVALERIADAAERSTQQADPNVIDLSVPVPRIDWQVENPRKNRYVLRNLGPDTAHNVSIDRERLGGTRVDISGPDDLTGMQSIELLVIESAQGARLANEMWVSCDEHEPRAVPIERWF